MNIAKISRAVITSAIVGGLATQATIASAGVFCRAVWPANITQCQNSEATADKAAATGTNSGGSNRTVTVNRIGGSTSAQAAALNAAGTAICTTPLDTSINGVSETVTCSIATAPSFLFVTAD